MKEQLTREEKIQIYLRATVPPSSWNPRTLRSARIQAERYFDRVSLYGELDIIKGKVE